MMDTLMRARPRSTRRRLSMTSLVLMLVAQWALSPLRVVPAHGALVVDWPHQGLDSMNSSNNTVESSIGPMNVAHLAPLWEVPDPVGSPLAAGGLLYYLCDAGLC